MKKLIAPTFLVTSAILATASVADARVQAASFGYLTSTEIGVGNNCASSSGASILNICDAGLGKEIPWYINLPIDNTGAKTPTINGWGYLFSDTTECRGYRMAKDGTIVGSATAWVTFGNGAAEDKTLGSLTLASGDTYVIGCYIGGKSGGVSPKLNTVSYSP
jgi:hypothetical protein